ncbi:MAG: alpha-mannosidase [Clostridia bacterium]|nr:alpha-mannosidase [Clostridia bacterium]
MQIQYRKVKRYLDILQENRWQDITPVPNIGMLPCDYKTDNTLPDPALFRPFPKGERWGEGVDTHAWFHFTLPAQKENTFLRVNTDYTGWDARNPQFIVYVNGRIVQGLDTNHLELLLPAGEALDVYLYGYIGSEHANSILYADTRVLNTEVDGLYYDIQFPFEALSFLGKESDEYAQTLYHMWRAVSILELYDVGSAEFMASVSDARAYLADEFYGKYCNTQKTTTICIGHTHIDCAWLWTLKQTREKVQRSFATVLELMRRYPEYKFMSSQALLYKNLKEEAPALYEEVKERIKEGRWECEGAMWVEADCNISSGESLVRQVLYGKTFFKKEFDVDNRVLWLPDVFGYSAALPQILRKSGVDWFVTSKISWNETNRMPYDTFKWRGIDGTEINTHFLTPQDAKSAPTERYTTYVGNSKSPMIAGTYKRYGQKQLNQEAILTFGYGDGGGGPTAEYLELIRRGAHGLPGLPNAKIDFAGNYLRRLEEKIENNPLLPRWDGELYLEFHRGTYTTMAKNKRYNRKCEFAYQNAELYGALARELCALPFPQDEIHDGWETILTNQFHDIIPGSSIKEVYDQSDIDYEAALAVARKSIDNSLRAIASLIGEDEGYVIFNPNAQGGRVPVQIDGVTVYADGIAPLGYTVCRDFVRGNTVKIDGRVVENSVMRVTFDDAWQITSIYDKANGREVLKAGAIGNELRVHADYPDNYDAWEWQAYSRDEYKTVTALTSATVVEDGIRRGVRLVRPYGQSTITQTLWFYDDVLRIDFDTAVDWHERHQMLKVVFPVDINASRATYEVQFGTVERPTHTNTSWDQAKFEVCAHKYADLSDGGYGVSLVNDCKYGHDIHDGVIQLSLLRGPTYPNPEADQGSHTFVYSLCPHAGTLAESDTVRVAYALNNPPVAIKACGKASTIPTRLSAVSTDAPNVICETVKPAEDGVGTVLRVYECQNKRTPTTLTLGLDAKKLYLCNMLEEPIREIPLVGGKFEYTFGGFEIATFKVV